MNILIASIIVVIIFIILLVTIWKLILRNEALEETLEESDAKVNYYEGKFVDIQEAVLNMQIELKTIDIRGSFEADDEVGFIFKDIQMLANDLVEVINQSYEKTVQ